MLNTTFIAVAMASIVSAVVTTLGLALIDQYRSWGQERSPYLISFAAGVLITVVFLHLIPKALEMHDGASYFLLLGFLGIYSRSATCPVGGRPRLCQRLALASGSGA